MPGPRAGGIETLSPGASRPISDAYSRGGTADTLPAADDGATRRAYRDRVSTRGVVESWPRGAPPWTGGAPPWPRAVPLVALAAFQLAGSLAAGHGQSDRRPLDGWAVALLVAGPAVLLL